MIYSKEQNFLAKFIYASNNISDFTSCHTLIVRNKYLRLVPCSTIKQTDIQIFRIMPAELTDGMTRSRWISMTDKYIKIKQTLELNDHGGTNGPEPKNPND